jgi:hypothetical protein
MQSDSEIDAGTPPIAGFPCSVASGTHAFCSENRVVFLQARVAVLLGRVELRQSAFIGPQPFCIKWLKWIAPLAGDTTCRYQVQYFGV